MDLEVAYRSYSSWTDGARLRGSLAVPFGMGWCFVAGGVCPWCARCCRRRARGVPRCHPGRAPSLSSLVLSLLPVSSAPLGCCSGSLWMRFASLRPGPWSSLVWPLADLALLWRFSLFAGPAVFAAFSELRGARQVERFAACSLLRRGAYVDRAERWSPGILSRPPPRKVSGREASGVVVDVVSVRWKRVDP